MNGDHNRIDPNCPCYRGDCVECCTKIKAAGQHARPTPPVFVFEIKGRRSFTRDDEERGGGRRDSSRSKEVK